LKGEAVPGAVEVDGGAANVRLPRDPELKPPPIRASAAETASTVGNASERITAKAFMRPPVRCMNFMWVS
jgi:hypothetical protein